LGVCAAPRRAAVARTKILSHEEFTPYTSDRRSRSCNPRRHQARPSTSKTSSRVYGAPHPSTHVAPATGRSTPANFVRLGYHFTCRTTTSCRFSSTLARTNVSTRCRNPPPATSSTHTPEASPSSSHRFVGLARSATSADCSKVCAGSTHRAPRSTLLAMSHPIPSRPQPGRAKLAPGPLTSRVLIPRLRGDSKMRAIAGSRQWPSRSRARRSSVDTGDGLRDLRRRVAAAGLVADGSRPYRFDVIGPLVCPAGVAVIIYARRGRCPTASPATSRRRAAAVARVSERMFRARLCQSLSEHQPVDTSSVVCASREGK